MCSHYSVYFMNHLLANKYPAGFMHQRLQNPIMAARARQAQLITAVKYCHVSFVGLIMSLCSSLCRVLHATLSKMCIYEDS